MREVCEDAVEPRSSSNGFRFPAQADQSVTDRRLLKHETPGVRARARDLSHPWWSASKSRMVVHDLSRLEMGTFVLAPARDAWHKMCLAIP